MLCGMEKVGKTAIAVRFTKDKFIEDYEPTTKKFYSKDIVVERQLQTLG